MADADSPGIELPRRRSVSLLKDQVQLVKKEDSDGYEVNPIADALSFEKGSYVVIRACQLLAEKNDGIILVGLAGPSGAGKTAFTEKLLHLKTDITVITMDNYIDSSRVTDGNFDDPRLTDYDTLLYNLQGLREGKSTEVPIYDFKTSCRTGYRKVEVPRSRIVIIEGIYALSRKLRGMLDLRVSITGGVHFDLVKRVLQDIQHADQEAEEMIQQILETVYPTYKAFIEPDLQTAHIKINNQFNPFTGFDNPAYTLKSTKEVTDNQIKEVLPESYTETWEETYDIYLLPPGENPETCQSYLRMRNRDGKYNLMFEECLMDSPFIISPRITFEVSFRLLGGLMALGYTVASILKRKSHIFASNRVCIKTDWLEQINRQYVQVQGQDRVYVKSIAQQLGLDGSYVPRTYIELLQLEKLICDAMTLPDDLKTKLRIDDDAASSPKKALSLASANRRQKYLSQDKHSTRLSKLAASKMNRTLNERAPASSSDKLKGLTSGDLAQLSDQVSAMSQMMENFRSCIEELYSKLNQSMASKPAAAEAGNGNSSEEVYPLLPILMNEEQKERRARTRKPTIKARFDPYAVALIATLTIGNLGVFLFKKLTTPK